MKKISLFFILLIAMLLNAQNPTINVQGVLRDADGNAVADGEKSMIFTFYNEASNGTALDWEESQAVVVINGVYNVQLGAQTPLNLPFDQTYFLEIQVDGETMEPRLALSMAPYSLSVRGLDNVFPNSGNVGIGTANPQAKLQVEGNTILNGNVTTSGNGAIAGTLGVAGANISGDNKLQVAGNTAITGELGVGVTDVASNNAFQVEGNSTISGNVGIGTTTPNSKLDVAGTLYVHEKATINGGLRVNGQVEAFGNRASWNQNTFNWGWNYAETDGMVNAYLEEWDGHEIKIIGLVTTDTNNDWGAVMGYQNIQDDNWGGSKKVSVCFPVRKGEHWKIVVREGDDNSAVEWDNFWAIFTPFGN